MSFSETYANWFKRLLPSPFTIAIILSLITFLAAIIVSNKEISDLANAWQIGIFDSSLLTFAFQMMLMLVLGHVLALSNFFSKIIRLLIQPLHNSASAAFVVCFSTILVAYINWGLGLIFGAIIARKVAESFSSRHINLNYPLIGACGYVGLMVWHGGLSGSSLVKVAETNHLREISGSNTLPEAIYFSDTVFSSMNITSAILILICLPLFVYMIGKRKSGTLVELPQSKQFKFEGFIQQKGAEKLDSSPVLNKSIGIIMLIVVLYTGISYSGAFLGFISPNFINLSLLALGIMLHKDIRTFLAAVEEAIKGASGILIQFPLYFGILALMKAGGLVDLSSDFFIAISNEVTLPVFTLFSAGFVNIFVPSGGGQWAIQGPIIIEAASQLNVPLSKCIMALAYGDQLTNMLQPFWALPLLSITGLKARDILPYTLPLMLIGTLIFISVLLIF